MTELLTPQPLRPPSPPEFAAGAELVRRVSRPRVALEAPSPDRTQLERQLAHLERELAVLRAENRRLRGQIERRPARMARAERRRMLAAQWSRNP